MRKIVFLFATVFMVVVGLNSCSNNNNPDNLIVGKWKVIAMWEEGECSFIEGELDEHAFSGIPFSAVCTFKKDGTCRGFFMNSIYADGKYALEDSELRITDLNVPLDLSSYFDVDAFENEEYSIRFEIEKLTGETLKVNGVIEYYEKIGKSLKEKVDECPIKVSLERI